MSFHPRSSAIRTRTFGFFANAPDKVTHPKNDKCIEFLQLKNQHKNLHFFLLWYILTTNLKKEIKKNVSDKHELELNFNKKDSERREVGLLHVYYKRLEERAT